MAPKIYPTKSDYVTAINNPQIAFKKKDPKTQLETDLDKVLVEGEAIKKPNASNPQIKEPWLEPGGFACVFKYQSFSPKKLWAVRCFTQSTSDVDSHYHKVSQRIKNISCPEYFIEFRFLDEGIRVKGNIYPILRMEWVEGKNLKNFIKDNCQNQSRLLELAEAWLKLSENLLKAGIAHGDLQHENILIDERNGGINIKLVDYDSLYFSQDGNTIQDQIKGREGYQHPLREHLQKQCLQIDFFAQWVIYLSIRALAEKPSLWQTYKLDATERLLFGEKDFKAPYQAQIFKDLPASLSTLADTFKDICQIKDFQKITSLVTALKPVDPIDVTNIFTAFSQKPPLSPPSSCPSVDATPIFTFSSQKPLSPTSSQNQAAMQQLQLNNLELTKQLDQVKEQLSQTKTQLSQIEQTLEKRTFVAVVSTTLALIFGGLLFYQNVIKKEVRYTTINDCSFSLCQKKYSLYKNP